MEQENSKIKILGQEIPYPGTWPAVAGLAVVSAAIAFSFYVYFVAAKPEGREAFNQLITRERYSPDGKLEEVKHERMIQFWTPSEKTQQELRKQGVISDQKKWQIVTEEKVDEFSKKLKGMDTVIGHRRFEVAGQGRSEFKRGWWWMVTIEREVKVKDFAKVYSEFLENKDSVYFEEIQVNEQFSSN